MRKSTGLHNRNHTAKGTYNPKGADSYGTWVNGKQTTPERIGGHPSDHKAWMETHRPAR